MWLTFLILGIIAVVVLAISLVILFVKRDTQANYNSLPQPEATSAPTQTPLSIFHIAKKTTPIATVSETPAIDPFTTPQPKAKPVHIDIGLSGFNPPATSTPKGFLTSNKRPDYNPNSNRSLADDKDTDSVKKILSFSAN